MLRVDIRVCQQEASLQFYASRLCQGQENRSHVAKIKKEKKYAWVAVCVMQKRSGKKQRRPTK